MVVHIVFLLCTVLLQISPEVWAHGIPCSPISLAALSCEAQEELMLSSDVSEDLH